MAGPPTAFIVGDSISIGYTPHVRRALEGRARVLRHAGNAGDSYNVLSNLGGWLEGIAPAVLYFNVGLHDLRVWRHTGAHQVPIEVYRKNAARLVASLADTDATLIWATTTPVAAGAAGPDKVFSRTDMDVEAYNAAALEAVREAGIAVNDLNAFVRDRGIERSLQPDGVHMTDETYADLGAEVARAIGEHLP